jgi:hypothetical protein
MKLFLGFILNFFISVNKNYFLYVDFIFHSLNLQILTV